MHARNVVVVVRGIQEKARRIYAYIEIYQIKADGDSATHYPYLQVQNTAAILLILRTTRWYEYEYTILADLACLEDAT